MDKVYVVMGERFGQPRRCLECIFKKEEDASAFCKEWSEKDKDYEYKYFYYQELVRE